MIGFAGTMAPDGHDLVGLCRLMAAENVQNVGTEWDVHNVQKVQKLNWNCRLYWDGFWMLKRIPEWLLIGWFMNAGMFFGWILNAQNDKTNLLQNDAWTLGQWTPRVMMLGQWIIVQVFDNSRMFAWKLAKKAKHIYIIDSLCASRHRVLYAKRKK